jgi:sulfur carrier protein ThiS
MKVKIRLFGTLRQRFPEYRHSEGLEVEIPDRATVKNLLALLEIPESRGTVAIMEGRILKADDKIRDGVTVNILQSIYGG